MFDEIGLAYPPHKYGEQVHDARRLRGRLELRHGAQLAKMLTVDKNGKDATQEGFDPDQDRPVGLRAPARRPARPGCLFGAGSSWPERTARRPDPDAWAAAWKYLQRDLDGPHDHDQPSSRDRRSTRRIPVLLRQGRDERQLPVVDLRPRRAEGDWDIAALPSYNGKTTAAFNADTFRILKDTKHPDEAFTVLTYLLGDASARAARDLRRHAGPDRRAGRVLRRARTQSLHPEADWQVAIDGVQFADNPNFEASMPNYNESLASAGASTRPGGDRPGPGHGPGVQTLQDRAPGGLGQA